MGRSIFSAMGSARLNMSPATASLQRAGRIILYSPSLTENLEGEYKPEIRKTRLFSLRLCVSSVKFSLAGGAKGNHGLYKNKRVTCDWLQVTRSNCWRR